MAETAPARSEVEFEDSNGKTRGLRYDFNALVEVEDKLGGKPFGQIAAELGAGMISFRDVRVLFMVGLNCYANEHDNKKLIVKVEQSGRVLQGIGVRKGIQFLNDAIKYAFPDVEEDADEDGEGETEGK